MGKKKNEKKGQAKEEIDRELGWLRWNENFQTVDERAEVDEGRSFAPKFLRSLMRIISRCNIVNRGSQAVSVRTSAARTDRTRCRRNVHRPAGNLIALDSMERGTNIDQSFFMHFIHSELCVFVITKQLKNSSTSALKRTQIAKFWRFRIVYIFSVG